MIKDGRTIYNWEKYQNRFGYVTLEPIRNSLAISKYVTKYIKKSIGSSVTELGKHTYYCSQGLQRKELIKKGSLPHGYEKELVQAFENDYLIQFDLTESQAKNFLMKL